MKYLLNIILSGFGKISSLFISIIVAKDGRNDVVASYILIYSQCVFSCYIGSLGVLQIWPAVHNKINSWSGFGLFCKINEISVFLVSLVVCFVYFHGGYDILPIFAFGVGCWSFYKINIAAYFFLVEGSSKKYSILNSAISFFVPFSMIFSKSKNDCYIWFSFINVVILVFLQIKVGKKLKFIQKEQKIESNFSFKKNVAPGFIGSVFVQWSQIFNQSKFIGVGGLGDTAAAFSIINQLKQIVLFVPNSIYAILLSDLSINKNNKIYRNKVLLAHLKISVVLFLASSAGCFVLVSFGLINKKHILPAILFVLSFCIIIVTNFFSRLAQSLLSNIWGMIFDIFFSSALFFGTLLFMNSNSIIDAAIVMLSSVIIQISVQIFWFFSLKDN